MTVSKKKRGSGGTPIPGEKTTNLLSRTASKKSLPGKEPLKTLYLRIPMSFWEDIQSIADLTGLSMNSVCIDLLRPAIKAKLKLLQEE